MTNAEQNRRIAKWLGWVHDGHANPYYDGLWRRPDGTKVSLPDFLTDEAASAFALDKLIMYEPSAYQQLSAEIWYWKLTGEKRRAATVRHALKYIDSMEEKP